jgi:TIR domain
MSATTRPSHGYTNDLYVSYAGIDNHTSSDRRGWVDELVVDLENTVSQMIGQRISLWIDRRRLVEGEDFSEQSKVALRSSALMLVVLSPGFVNSQHCMRELDAFVAANGINRVIKLKRLPVDDPPVLADLSSFLFYRRTSEGLMQGLVGPHYQRAIDALAQHVALLLKGIASSGPETPRDSDMSVFLCHSSGDKKAVRSLWSRLKADGVRPWLDEVDIAPGVKWEPAIRTAIDGAGAIVVCLSSRSVGREGFLQREIRMALDKAEEKPDDTVFLIPARLELCDVPQRLREYQWVDIFDAAGYSRLLQALRIRARALATRSAK